MSQLLSDQPESALSADCPSTHRCEVPNDVRNIEKGVCCPRPQFVCNTPPKQSFMSECDASVTQNVTRWWFNSVKGKCVKYSHPDCESVLDDRSNSFVSERKCQEYCRNAKICPSSFVPLPDDGVAPYRFCDPMANSSDFVRSCYGGKSARCQYSKYLKHHVCCVKDSAKSFTNRFISQMRLTTRMPTNSINEIKNWRRGSYASSNGSTRCCKFNKKSDSEHRSIQPALAIDLKVVIVLFWLSGISLALLTGICCCVIAKRYRATLIIPLSNSLTINKENDMPSKMDANVSLSAETTCVYNPYSECPIEFKRKSDEKF
ncbi:kunitz/Bovine pancreatic trypsin inhibitor domain-containing protein [Ditylenchus destructor]|uniref:Kunitz/Bovine pancreatic trypsin inhibitor domain-containing protein n=1 Tax=Ditylenchus destructor TaxID=166010 RepID=A0AAD4NGZ2_9BILA|nr:kunitz/Bovine pancreatic trypsin inhibitor domain-containing protein [Ditylenchus destructor]